MQNLLPIAPGLILDGRRERLGATRLAARRMYEFAAFTGSWPAKSRSDSFSRPNLKSPTRLALSGSDFSLRGKFPSASRMIRLRFQWKSVYFGIVATRLALSGSEF